MSDQVEGNGNMSDQEFQESLLFYVNGTLSDERRQAMEHYLAVHPAARTDLSFLQAAQRAMASEYEEMDPLEGYEDFKKRLAALQQPAAAPRRSGDHWWQTMKDRFREWGMSPAVALLIALVGAQLMFSLSGNVGRESDTSTGSAMRSMEMAARIAEIKIIVKQGVPFENVIALLMENRCTIVWGPSQLGELWLVVEPKGTAAAVAQRLTAAPILENVQVLDASASK